MDSPLDDGVLGLLLERDKLTTRVEDRGGRAARSLRMTADLPSLGPRCCKCWKLMGFEMSDLRLVPPAAIAAAATEDEADDAVEFE